MQPDQRNPQPSPPDSPPPLNHSPPSGHHMLEPNEHVLTVIKRHFIGLVFAYLQVLAAFVALVALAAVVLPGFINDLTAGTSATLTIAAILLLTLLVLVLFLVTTIYWQNKLVLTDQALLQTLQTGPFHQKVSRLDMADIQDVTTEQKGLLPTIFNYGTLHVETAGELRNFAFKYTPDPSRYATMIIEARHNASSHNH